jgi:hypothetical protein
VEEEEEEGSRTKKRMRKRKKPMRKMDSSVRSCFCCWDLVDVLLVDVNG